ncbi:hypothetical protein PC116_g33127 [Phytophthora cactorum]|nr:hypothetical protein PC116_g33127 [Phytophthora cactorum]
MGIFHVVMFKFKDLVPPEEVKAACDRMLALGSKCIHPTSQKPYIKVHGGGKDNSPEGKQVTTPSYIILLMFSCFRKTSL